MPEVVEMKRKPDPAAVEIMRELLALAEAGALTDVVVVGCTRDDAETPVFLQTSQFQNAWEILGALEYAKTSILKKIKAL